jgi:hypothetical protein
MVIELKNKKAKRETSEDSSSPADIKAIAEAKLAKKERKMKRREAKERERVAKESEDTSLYTAVEPVKGVDDSLYTVVEPEIMPKEDDSLYTVVEPIRGGRGNDDSLYTTVEPIRGDDDSLYTVVQPLYTDIEPMTRASVFEQPKEKGGTAKPKLSKKKAKNGKKDGDKPDRPLLVAKPAMYKKSRKRAMQLAKKAAAKRVAIVESTASAAI